MRMDEMNKLFEEQGFTVERRYENNGYRFTISKDNNYRSERFIYPCGAGSARANQIQRDFVKDMIEKFELEFKTPGVILKPINPTYGFTLGSMWTDGAIFKYCNDDVEVTEKMWTKVNPFCTNGYGIKNVIFNDPATIVFWTDGTKTVVKCQDGDVFDPEKGLTMAISKKALGNKGNYCNELKRWLPKKYFCMYCGAETTNDSWDHECDECKNEPFEPIPETLKKKIYDGIKFPDLSGLKDAAKKIEDFSKALKKQKRESSVQKAYDILVNVRDSKCTGNDSLDGLIDQVVGYLGEALED